MCRDPSGLFFQAGANTARLPACRQAPSAASCQLTKLCYPYSLFFHTRDMRPHAKACAHTECLPGSPPVAELVCLVLPLSQQLAARCRLCVPRMPLLIELHVLVVLIVAGSAASCECRCCLCVRVCD